ncbi:hypothetical protein ADL26_15210, partial [Thermoactinomyces vulgaris]
MSDMLNKLNERRNNVWEQAKALADTAANDNRSFSAEEQGTWDALNEELDKLDARMKSAAEAEKRAQEAEKMFEGLRGKPEGNGPEDEKRAQNS